MKSSKSLLATGLHFGHHLTDGYCLRTSSPLSIPAQTSPTAFTNIDKLSSAHSEWHRAFQSAQRYLTFPLSTGVLKSCHCAISSYSIVDGRPYRLSLCYFKHQPASLSSSILPAIQLKDQKCICASCSCLANQKNFSRYTNSRCHSLHSQINSRGTQFSRYTKFSRYTNSRGTMHAFTKDGLIQRGLYSNCTGSAT